MQTIPSKSVLATGGEPNDLLLLTEVETEDLFHFANPATMKYFLDNDNAAGAALAQLNIMLPVTSAFNANTAEGGDEGEEVVEEEVLLPLTKVEATPNALEVQHSAALPILQPFAALTYPIKASVSRPAGAIVDDFQSIEDNAISPHHFAEDSGRQHLALRSPQN